MKLTILAAVLMMTFTLVPLTAQASQTGQATQEAVENLKPYPKTMDGMERYVIFLAPQENESLFSVELVAGKTMEADCNHHRLLGQFTEHDVQGWGYNYFTFKTGGEIASTLMACPGPKTKKFIEAEGMMVRYNSRLPLVVFMPEGYELQYRIWTAGAIQHAEKR